MSYDFDISASGVWAVILGPIVLGAILLMAAQGIGWVFVGIGVVFGPIVLLGGAFGEGGGF